MQCFCCLSWTYYVVKNLRCPICRFQPEVGHHNALLSSSPQIAKFTFLWHIQCHGFLVAFAGDLFKMVQELVSGVLVFHTWECFPEKIVKLPSGMSYSTHQLTQYLTMLNENQPYILTLAQHRTPFDIVHLNMKLVFAHKGPICIPNIHILCSNEIFAYPTTGPCSFLLHLPSFPGPYSRWLNN